MAGGVRGRGACVAGHAWWGACVAGVAWQGGVCRRGACVAGGVHDGGVCIAGGACMPHTTPRHYEIQSVNARAVRILLECILVEKNICGTGPFHSRRCYHKFEVFKSIHPSTISREFEICGLRVAYVYERY